MKNLYKDQIRKIKYNLFNFISLSILVIIISLTFTSIKTVLIRLERNYDPYLATQNVEEFQFTLSSVNIDLLGGNALWYICEELELEHECAINISIGTDAAMTNLNHIINQQIEERPDLVDGIIAEYIENITAEYGFEVEEKWVVDVQDGEYNYRFLTLTSVIDIPYIIEGTLPVQENEIAVFPEFAEHNSLSIKDTITIKEQDYTITAFVYTPDYAFPIYYMNPMDVHTETVALTNQATVEGLNEHIDKIYVGRGDLTQLLDETTYKEVTETDVSSLGVNTQHLKSIKPASANYKLAMLPLEVENGKLFMNSFVTIFVLFTGLLFTIFLKRYIDKNKKDINTLQSLGYTNNEITKSLMIFPLLISFMSIIGYLIGTLGSSIVFESYAQRYLFPKAPFEIYGNILLLSVLGPILFINLVSYTFILLNLQRRKKITIRRIKIKLFKFTPTKTIIQTFALLIVVSIMILFAIGANDIFTTFTETTKVGNNFEEALRLDYFTDDDIPEDYETFTRLKANAKDVNGNDVKFSFAIYGIDSDTTLKALFENDPAQNIQLEDGIIISEYLRYNQDIEIGDEMTFLVEGTSFTYTVVGITNELIENNAFVLKEELNAAYNLDNTFYNGIYTTDRSYQSDNILIRISYIDAIDDILSTMRTSSNIVYFILSLSGTIGLFMFGFIILNYLSDNRKNIAILKSIGYNSNEINRKYITAIVITFLIAFVVAIPTTRILFDLLLRNIINQLGYILILDVTFSNIVIAFLLLALIFIITIHFINNYYKKVSIIEILKTEVN